MEALGRASLGLAEKQAHVARPTRIQWLGLGLNAQLPADDGQQGQTQVAELHSETEMVVLATPLANDEQSGAENV